MIGTQIRIVGWNRVIDMYSIDLYLAQTFIFPIIVLVFIFIVFCGASYKFIRAIAKKEADIINTLEYIVLLVALVGFSFINVTSLVNGGIVLAQETEEDILVTQGFISSIYSPSTRILGFKEGAHRGADIYIDQEQYFVANAENFEMGDYVEIWYLPRSHFILRIARVDLNRADE